MFIVSQILLNQTKVCENKNISTYAIAFGLTTYAIVYVYMLFYNNEAISSFNNYIFYIIGIDLFLSAFYSYYQTDNKPVKFNKNQNDTVETYINDNDKQNIKQETDGDEEETEEQDEEEIEEQDEKEDEEENEKGDEKEIVEQGVEQSVEQGVEQGVEKSVEKSVEGDVEQGVEGDVRSDSEVEITRKLLLDNHSEPVEQMEIKKRRGRPSKVMLI